jgi:ubiquinone/menaquinone biosynthesis C-methylase UbiE
MKRSVTQELLDGDTGTSKEITGSIEDLAMIAHRFGGASTLVSLLLRVAERSSLRQMSVLDVGAGSDVVAKMARKELAQHGVSASFTLLDRSVRQRRNGTQWIIAEALHLPLADLSFDVVACSTFAHHLEPEELVKFVNGALRVARYAVVINDIRRHPVHLGLVYAGFPLFRSRITRHDGPASVRRAYTSSELSEILKHSNAARVELSQHYLFRMGGIAWKQ